jgi:Tol biopolymer transport system component/predicted Ser/Thr protein kinase
VALVNGARLGPYEILAPLGQGGMGEVYKARDTRLDRTVAIKVLPAQFAADPQFRERFDREAKAISQLNHPHICTLYDVGQQDGTDFLVMEYLEGETLADRLAGSGLKAQGLGLPFGEALTIAIQIASALDKAHRAGIVHRDLKPGNIMLTKAGAKLLDFGLAKTGSAPVIGSVRLQPDRESMLPTTPANLTAQGTILGTFQYMAPEQLEGQDADARTDLFAFGALVYEMLTGKKAFEGKSHASLIAAILDHDPPPISTIQPLTPLALDRVVKKCLAKEPDERWQSAKDLHDELTWIAEAGPQASAPAPVVAPPKGLESSIRFAWVVAAFALVAVAALAIPAVRYVREVAPEPVVTRLDVVTPPTSDAFSFALSPDGRQLAFVANGEKGSQLWLRPLDQVAAQPLAGTEGAAFRFWAPDSRALGFFADGKLKRIDLAGGAPQVLADVPLARGGTWNRDGVIVFGQATPGALMRVMATGGTPVPITRVVAGQGSHRWPQFLPDGRRVIFAMLSGQPQTHGVYVASLDGGEPTRVVPAETAAAYAPPGYLLLVRQGVLLVQPFDAARATVAGEPIPVAQSVGTDDGFFHSAFSVSATGVLAHRAGAAPRRQLVWVDRAGKGLGAIRPPDEVTVSNPEVAPDGQRVAVNRNVQGNIDVWLIEVGRGLASRFTFDPSNDRSPLLSPDGSQVIFQSSRKGVYDLFEKPASGATDEQPLLVTPQDKATLDWSRDGRFLLYSTQDPKTGSDLWALPLTGERKPFPVVQTSFDEIEGQFSPDGRWLAYASNESGRYEIYSRPFPGAGGKWQVSTAGGTQPRWGRDGKELFYMVPDTRLMAVQIRVASDGRALDTGAPVALFPTRLASGADIQTTGFGARAQYAVASDGRFLMLVTADEAVTSPITIVLNWTAGLTPVTGAR